MSRLPPYFLAFIFGTICRFASGQNTVGLLSYVPEASFPGYDLLYPDNQSTVYLINQCGEIVHFWPDSSVYRPGDVAYLQPNGLLFKSKRNRSAVVDPIWAGGGGEFIEIRDWDNQLLYSFRLNDEIRRLHHDFTVLPNGNIVAISWEVKTGQEAIDQGRDPALIYNDQVWPDYLLEIDPSTDSIVWEWHVWDHLIQDFDPGKANYGVIRDHPERININYVQEEVRSDWLHSNSIVYQPDLDHLLLSVPHFDEIWIIDHSTTTEEAAGSTGGRSGKGGDLLYRWGNPQTYDRGQERHQQLFFQHDARWITDTIKNDLSRHRISVFNNRVRENYSTANILTVGFDTVTWGYPERGNQTWGPESFDEVIYHPDTFSLNSESVSSFQLLPNNNRLILSGRFGYVFELTPEGQLVWDYRVPFRAGRPVSQGAILSRSDNFTFRYDRYPVGFPGLEGKDLSPLGYLELDPDEDFCLQLTPVYDKEISGLFIYPNPFENYLEIISGSPDQSVRIFDISGRLVAAFDLAPGRNLLDVHTWFTGVYILTGNHTSTQYRLLKIR